MTLWAAVRVPSKIFLDSDQSGVREKCSYSPYLQWENWDYVKPDAAL